jgi:hypothetical protein
MTLPGCAPGTVVDGAKPRGRPPDVFQGSPLLANQKNNIGGLTDFPIYE